MIATIVLVPLVIILIIAVVLVTIAWVLHVFLARLFWNGIKHL